jgi:PhzF family phenazine biosynthesis protein
MTVQLFQVDAFSDQPFGGNPAAVCLLSQPQAGEWMQAVAGEMNLSETAFVWPVENGYSLRWFTPQIEVDLCGHATIASAHAMWTENVVPQEQPISFQTRSGTLTAKRSADLIELDFPATPPTECESTKTLQESLGVNPSFVGRTKFDSFVVVDSEEVVRSLKPDFRKLAEVASRGVIVTSRSSSSDFDFVSRFFAPAAGIDEDPVTGSAHCALAPYWSNLLGKTSMIAYQASTRGGIVRVNHQADRVILGGQAVTVLRGALNC